MSVQPPPIDPSSWPEGVDIASVAEEDFSYMLDVLETAFPDLSRTFFHAITLRDPGYRPEYSLAVQQGRRCHACLQIFDRTLRIGGETLRFGGIGSVGTRPSCQGRGYASALLKRATHVMQQEGMAGSMLFTTIHPFYERLGWRTLSQSEQDIAVYRLLTYPFRLEWIRPLRDGDYPHLHAMYLTMQERMGGGLIRTQAFWRARANWLTHFPIVVTENDEILGYFYFAQYDLKKPVMTVSEYGFREPDSFILERMLRAMARKAEELGCDTLRSFFLQDPVLGAFCQENDYFVDERDFRYAMWKDLGEVTWLDRLQDHARRKKLFLWTTDAF